MVLKNSSFIFQKIGRPVKLCEKTLYLYSEKSVRYVRKAQKLVEFFPVVDEGEDGAGPERHRRRPDRDRCHLLRGVPAHVQLCVRHDRRRHQQHQCSAETRGGYRQL